MKLDTRLGLQCFLKHLMLWFSVVRWGHGGELMGRVAVDIVGPLPQTSRQNHFVSMTMDYFTKWHQAYPLSNHEATTMAQVLGSEFFCHFGLPRELHSDQGQES